MGFKLKAFLTLSPILSFSAPRGAVALKWLPLYSMGFMIRQLPPLPQGKCSKSGDHWDCPSRVERPLREWKTQRKVLDSTEHSIADPAPSIPVSTPTPECFSLAHPLLQVECSVPLACAGSPGSRSEWMYMKD